MSNERWEYKVMLAPVSVWGTSKPELVTEALNREGMQGWELVNVIQHGTRLNLFLKRRR